MTRRRRLTWLGSLTCAVLICLWMTSRQADVAIPSYAAVRAAYQASDISILDRNGEVLHERRVDPRGRRLAWTPLADISPALQAAVIASEDRRFYRHGGVDALAFVGAGCAGPSDGRGVAPARSQCSSRH